MLIGFELGKGRFLNRETVNAFCPIYLTKSGEKRGRWQGPPPAEPVVIKAKPGYVVGAISLRAGLIIDGLSATFFKVGKNRLEVNSTYNSSWVGSEGGSPSVLGGEGAIFVGIRGNLNNQQIPCSLGLIALLPKE